MNIRPINLAALLGAFVLFGGAFAYMSAPESQLATPAIIEVEGSSHETREEARVSPAPKTPLSEPEAAPTAATASPSGQSFYTIPVVSETTVLQTMEAYAEANGDFSFSGREFPGLGFFVEEIGGLRNRDGFYWTLFINNALSEKGAAAAEVSSGDTRVPRSWFLR